VCRVRGAAAEQPHDRVGYLEIHIVQRRGRHRDDVARRQGGDSHEVNVTGAEYELAAGSGDLSSLDDLERGRCDVVVGGLHVNDVCARRRAEGVDGHVELVHTVMKVDAVERGITGSSHTHEPGSSGIDHEAAQRAEAGRRRAPQLIVDGIVALTLPRSAAGEQTDEGVRILEDHVVQGSGRHRDDVSDAQITDPEVVDVAGDQCERSPIRSHRGGGNNLNGGRPD